MLRFQSHFRYRRLAFDSAPDHWALIVPGAEFFVVAEDDDVWDNPNLAVRLLQTAIAGNSQRAGDHEQLRRDGAIFQSFSSFVMPRTFVFGVRMPNGVPVAGVMQVSLLETNGEPARIRVFHKYFPSSAAKKALNEPLKTKTELIN